MYKDFMKFYATLGPSCQKIETLRAMRRVGMTGIRYNLAHGAFSDVVPLLKQLSDEAKEKGASFDILLDLEGAKLRIGRLAALVALTEGDTVSLSPADIPLPDAVQQVLRAGDHLNFDDKKILLEVTDVLDAGHATAQVLRGGLLESGKTVKLEGRDIALPILTDRDRQHLEEARECGITEVMVPFVECAEDVLEVRKVLDTLGLSHVKIHAKIENKNGVANIDAIIPVADMVVIARGDLGNDVDLWDLPKLQKQMSQACGEADKPFLVVTQMLDSMIRNAVPTRAEVSDVYNATLDGASALMLTGETAVGKYPVEAMRYLVNTAKTVNSAKTNNTTKNSEDRETINTAKRATAQTKEDK